MKRFHFLIFDEDQTNALKTKQVSESFSNLYFLGFANTYTEGIDKVLATMPDIVFLQLNSNATHNEFSLRIIDELHRYLNTIPKIIVLANDESFCLESFRYGVFDYLVNPLLESELRKTIFKLQKNSSVQYSDNEAEIKKLATFETSIKSPQPIERFENEDTVEENLALNHSIPNTNSDLTICVKTYGDYRYIDAKSIRYLTADNNSTDIHLDTGEVVTAFKTLKTFENVLKFPFYRIHHSCIANVQHISRIHTGNSTCYIKNTTLKLRFSKTYRDNIDQIIKIISGGNYIEI